MHGEIAFYTKFKREHYLVSFKYDINGKNLVHLEKVIIFNTTIWNLMGYIYYNATKKNSVLSTINTIKMYYTKNINYKVIVNERIGIIKNWLMINHRINKI